MSGELMDAPNQQAVGLDPPWVEGTGGSSEAEPQPTGDEDGEPTLDEMTKNQLLAHAEREGLDVDDSMTKSEIRAAIEEAEG